VHALVEKCGRIVIRPTLDILWQANECRTAICRIQYCGKRDRERLQDLRRVRDPVPEPADCLERVVDPKCWIAEMLKLLQHRIRQPGDECIAAQEQHGQAVGMGKGGSGQQVRRARPGARRAKHEAAAQMVFGISRRCKPHALLVLAAIKRQFLLQAVERLTEARHIAMPENPESAAADALLRTVNDDVLVGEIAGDGLSDSQTNCH
jgi:hypothetical protein